LIEDYPLWYFSSFCTSTYSKKRSILAGISFFGGDTMVLAQALSRHEVLKQVSY